MSTIPQRLVASFVENGGCIDSGLEILKASGATLSNAVGPPIPSPKTRRWVPHRKAEVVYAVRAGFLSLSDALERYNLSMDEYLAWQRGVDIFGLSGLRVCWIQKTRFPQGTGRIMNGANEKSLSGLQET